MCFTPVSVGAELIQTGKVRALAVSGTLRSHALLNVPTFAEAGVADFAFEAWFGLLAPASTPPSTLNKISGDVGALLNSEEMTRLFMAQGVTTVDPEEFTALLKSEAVRFGELLPRAQN
jgi:tripartite-type tricarboxylate transporter receptor subunit TctC